MENKSIDSKSKDTKIIKTNKNSGNKKQYERPPEGTITDRLQTNKDMEEKLTDYLRVDDFDDIPIDCHVRYVTWDKNNKKQRFCLGGFLKRKFPDYCVLSNGKVNWCVQKFIFNEDIPNNKFKVIFFKKKTREDSLEEVIIEKEDEITLREEELDKKDKDISLLTTKIQIQGDTINSMESELIKQKKQIERLVAFIESQPR